MYTQNTDTVPFTILLIEESETLRRELKRRFSSYGLMVIDCESEEKAREILDKYGCIIDVVTRPHEK